MTKIKVPARHLMSGDQLCTGETVSAVSRGAWTPGGKVEVTLEKDGHRRAALWGTSTTINVHRPANRVTGKVEALGSLLSELAKFDMGPDGAALLAPHTESLTSVLTTHQLICSACVADPRKEANGTR